MSSIDISLEFDDCQAPSKLWKQEDNRHSCFFCEHRENRNCYAISEALQDAFLKNVYLHVYLEDLTGICDAYEFNAHMFFDEFGELPNGDSIYEPE